MDRQGIEEFSVVFEASHPLGPVIGHDVAGFGPRAPGVEAAMPLQGPQLLEADFSCGPIHKQDIYSSIMSIGAENTHLASRYPNFRARLPIVFRRDVDGERLPIRPPDPVPHDRHIIQTFMIDASPVILEAATEAGIVAIINPLIECVAAAAISAVFDD